MKEGGVRIVLASNIREVVFGIEDSLVSTFGAITGVAAGSGQSGIVILSGLVIVMVEAISMAAGSYLSSKAATELYNERLKKNEKHLLAVNVTDQESLQGLFKRKGFSTAETKFALQAIIKERRAWLEEIRRVEYRLSPAIAQSPWLASIIMFLFYILGGLLVLTPYLIFTINTALWVAAVIAGLALFFLGVWKASIAGVPKARSGLEMVMVSLLAGVVGIMIGTWAKYSGLV